MYTIYRYTVIVYIIYACTVLVPLQPPLCWKSNIVLLFIAKKLGTINCAGLKNQMKLHHLIFINIYVN